MKCAGCRLILTTLLDDQSVLFWVLWMSFIRVTCTSKDRDVAVTILTQFFLQNPGTYCTTHQRTWGIARKYSWWLENEGHDWIKSSQTAKLPKTGLIANRLISFWQYSGNRTRNIEIHITLHYITGIILCMGLRVPFAPYCTFWSFFFFRPVTNYLFRERLRPIKLTCDHGTSGLAYK